MKKQIVCRLCGSNRHYQSFCPSRNIMPGKKPCKYCGDPNHSSITCFKKPRRRIRKESIKAKTERQKFQDILFKTYPPDENGNWQCYLNISPYCFKVLNKDNLIWEHVKPRATHPHLKYVVSNIKPSCEPCNVLKSGKSLEVLAEIYPHLNKYLVDTSH